MKSINSQEGKFKSNTKFLPNEILTLKHIAVISMIAIALYRSLVLKEAATPSQEKLKGSLMMVNLILGVIILLLSGFTAAITSSAAMLLRPTKY
jgi:putative copper export protein